jgi:hypothetical protein
MDTLYRPPEEVREHARQSALAGREVWCNPHIGADAEVWFAAYREVPEALRGSQPDTRPKPHRVRSKRKTDMSAAGVQALGDRCLAGSTPRTFAGDIRAEVAEAEARMPKPWAVTGAGL